MDTAIQVIKQVVALWNQGKITNGSAMAKVAAVAPDLKMSPLPALSPLDTQIGGSHYKGFKIQPIEFAAANGLNFLEGNVVKYTVRRKGDKAKRLEDLRKAIDNLTKLIYFIESDICS